MSERPIIFSGPMVRAILDGRKHQTRRVVKLRPPYTMDERDEGRPCPWPWATTWSAGDADDGWMPFPYGRDRLWVRETWASDVPGCERGLSYRADHRDPLGDGPAHPMRWRSPIHMPRWASRITLEVTEVRVQRLQDISEADAFAEGVTPVMADTLGGGLPRVVAFERAWEKIHGKRCPWSSNPWVWALTFRPVQP